MNRLRGTGKSPCLSACLSRHGKGEILEPFDQKPIPYVENGEIKLAEPGKGKSNIIIRQDIYDRMSALLTEYEELENKGHLTPPMFVRLYDMLVEIQNNWESVITADD
jgi:hypothetical protein